MTDPISNAYLSLPEQVASLLQAEIEKNRTPGDRLPTVLELSQEFGVSKHTISNAIEILSQRGVLSKKRGRGMFVNQRTTRLRIGILSEMDLFDHRISRYWQDLASKISNALQSAGCEPDLYMGSVQPATLSDEPTCPRFWDDIHSGRLDGAIILDVPATAAWNQRLRTCPIPLLGSLTDHLCDLNYAEICDLALQRLAEQGCKSVGLLAWQPPLAFIQAAQRKGLHTCASWIRTDLNPSMPGAGWEEFREIWSSPDGQPDGLLVLDDMLFAGVQLAVLELGLQIPQDLKLAALTHREAASLIRLPATIIEIDLLETASELTDLILRRIQGKASPTKHLPFLFRERPPSKLATKEHRPRKPSKVTL